MLGIQRFLVGQAFGIWGLKSFDEDRIVGWGFSEISGNKDFSRFIDQRSNEWKFKDKT